MFKIIRYIVSLTIVILNFSVLSVKAQFIHCEKAITFFYDVKLAVTDQFDFTIYYSVLGTIHSSKLVFGTPCILGKEYELTGIDYWGYHKIGVQQCGGNPNCIYSYNASGFSETPFSGGDFSIHDNFYCVDCPPQNILYEIEFYRKDNNLSLPSSNSFDTPFIFTGHNFDTKLKEHLHIELYDDENHTHPALASFDLPKEKISFNLKDTLPLLYKSLINKTIYFSTNYVSDVVDYAASDYANPPVYITDHVDLSKSTIEPVTPSCIGASDGGFKLSKIMMVSGVQAADKDIFNAVLRQKICGSNNCVWKSLTITGGATTDFVNSSIFTVGETSSNVFPAGSYTLVIYKDKVAADSCNFTISNPQPVGYTISQPIAYTFDVNSRSSTINLTCSNEKSTVRINPISPTNGGNFQVTLTPTGYLKDTHSGILTDGFTDFTNLGPNTYSLEITDSKGCPLLASSTILINPGLDPVISEGTLTLPACSNYLGTKSISVTNQAPSSSVNDPLSFWKSKDGITSSESKSVTGTTFEYTYNNIDVGTYTLYVSDKSNCKSNEIIVPITKYADPISTVIATPVQKPGTTFHLLCNGDTDGQITASATTVAGTTISSYSLQEEPGNISNNGLITGLSAGTYHVVVKNSQGCTALSGEIILNQPPTPLSFIVNKKIYSNNYNISCHDTTNNGEISFANYIGGVGTYQFAVDDNSKYQYGDLFKHLDKGPHTLYLKDAIGCEVQRNNVELSKPEPYVITTVKSSYHGADISCFNANDGGFSFTGITGAAMGPFQYRLNGELVFNTVASRTGLPAGNDTLWVKDALNCITAQTLSITQPQELSMSFDVADFNGYNVACNEDLGSATAIPIGGTGTAGDCTYLWSDGRTIPTVNNLSPGVTYTATITDLNNCTANNTVNLTKPDKLKINSIIPTHLTCYQDNTGALEVITEGGVNGQTITLLKDNVPIASQTDQPIGSNVYFNNLEAGTYVVQLGDPNLCSDVASITLTEPDKLDFNFKTADYNGFSIRCHGMTDTITTEISGGTAPYSFKWNNNVVKSFLTNAYADSTYTMTVTDANSCKIPHNIKLIQPEPLQITRKERILPTCSYTLNGSATIHVKGGILPYTFTLNAQSQLLNDTIAIFSSLASLTDYPIQINDKNECTAIDTIMLNNRPVLQLIPAVTSPPHCNGGNDGAMKIGATDGKKINNFSYHYALFDSKTVLKDSQTNDKADFKLLQADHYTVTVTDSFGCSASLPVEIVDAPMIHVKISETPNKCFNDNTAQIKVEASGGYQPYYFAYEYDNKTLDFTVEGDSTLNIPNLNWNVFNTNAPVTYHLHVYDKNYTPGQPCIVDNNYLITPIQKMDAEVIDTPISCLGSNDASLRINQVMDNFGPFTYQWTGSQQGYAASGVQTISNLRAGTYDLVITDARSCQYIYSKTFTNPEPLGVEVISTTPISGLGQNDGQAYLKVSGTDLTISYRLDDIPTIYSATVDRMTIRVLNLSAGKHTITIFNTGHESCSVNTPFIVNYPAPTLLLNAMGTLDASSGKSDGVLLVEAKGGAGGGNNGYTYYWKDENGNPLPSFFKKAQATGLGKGDYTVFVKDQDSVASNTVSAFIGESDKLTLILEGNSHYPTCRLSADGTASVSAHHGSGRYNYWWTNTNGAILSNDSTITSQKIGSYMAHVQDREDLRSKDSIKVNVTSPDTIQRINYWITTPRCFNEHSAAITIQSIVGGSGSYAYAWSTGSTANMVTGLGLGNISLRVFDNAAPGNVCFRDTSFAITIQPQPLLLSIDNITVPTCHNGTDGIIQASVTGGTSPNPIIWKNYSTTGNILNNAVTGKQFLTVTDANNCVATDSVIVENPTRLTVDATIKQPSCYGNKNGKIALNVLNGKPQFKAQWTPELNTTDLNVDVPAGNYSVTLTDYNGCSADTFFVMNEPLPLTIDSFSITLPMCNNSANGAIKAYASGGTPSYIYAWNDPKKQFGQLLSGIKGSILPYSVEVTDRHYCKYTKTVTLQNPLPLLLTIDGAMPLCSGYHDGTITLTASGGTESYNYFINDKPSSPTIENLEANIYNFKVVDTNGCSTTTGSYHLKEPTPLVVSLEGTLSIQCANQCNGAVSILASGSFGPYNALWQDDIQSLIRADLCAGTYAVRIQDSHQCEIPVNVTITAPNELTVSQFTAISPTCSGTCDGSLDAEFSGGTLPYQLNWNNEDPSTLTEPLFSKKDLCAGDYPVSITDAHNCNVYNLFTIDPTNKVTIPAIAQDLEICEGQQNIIFPGDWQTYAWYFNGQQVSDSLAFNANKTGDYKLNVVSALGCSDSATFSVTVSKDLLKADFLIPNDAIVGDTVEIIDISWPVPDSITWEISPANMQLIGKSQDRQQIVFTQSGEYTLNMMAYKAMCNSENIQTITVFSSSEDKTDGKQPVPSPGEIETLYLFPNPSSGSFTVKITLSDVGEVHLYLYRMAENALIATKDGESNDTYEFPFDMPGLSSGVYILNVKTKTHSKTIKFIILK